MNIFTRGHPLDSQSNAKPRVCSYFLGALLASFIICPLFAIGLWFLDVTDNGDTTGGYTPAPFWVDLLVSMVVSFIVAFLGACVLMLFALLFAKFGRKRLTYAA